MKIIKQENMKSKMNIQIEANIMAALFRATIEQSSMICGELKQKPKHDFNVWMKHGIKLLNGLGIDEGNEYADIITDPLHEQIHEIRKALNELEK